MEDEIAAALKQVGAGAAGANVPELLETIMGAMASGIVSEQQPGARGGGGKKSSAPSVLLQEPTLIGRSMTGIWWQG